MRYFRVHNISKGLVDLAEIREDGEVIGLPVSLPMGTTLKGANGFSWVILRRVGQSLGFNRPCSTGMEFSLVN